MMSPVPPIANYANTPPFPPFDAFTNVDIESDAAKQLDTERRIFLTMLMRGPLSPKLSLTWMILIAAVGPLIRAEMARSAAYKKKKTIGNFAKLALARVIAYLLVPLVVVASMIAVISMLYAIYCMFAQIQLIGIWSTIVLVLLVRIPVDQFFEAIGCGDAPVNYKGFKSKATIFLIWCSEGPTFKYCVWPLIELWTTHAHHHVYCGAMPLTPYARTQSSRPACRWQPSCFNSTCSRSRSLRWSFKPAPSATMRSSRRTAG